MLKLSTVAMVWLKTSLTESPLGCILVEIAVILHVCLDRPAVVISILFGEKAPPPAVRAEIIPGLIILKLTIWAGCGRFCTHG
ncbi:MAG: hypothetical protein QM368_02820 [Bacillota bacterium]|nr:hypothetical protein [Bacillota bacterium]HHU29621.1 hypothetical protein [Bacillota bacterium]